MPRVRLQGVAADWARQEYARYFAAHPGTPQDSVGFGFVSKANFETYAQQAKWMIVARDSLVETIRESWDHSQNKDFACFPSAENTIYVMLSLY